MTAALWLEESRRRVDQALDAAWPAGDAPPEPLHQAVRHALMAPGKRFRPALVYGGAELLGLPLDTVTPAALAAELVHTYSLVHDDLPAMDNDDWRRGRPTVHRAFSEDIAILAGDALLAEAFWQLARAPYGAPHLLAAMRDLAGAASYRGLVGGQVRDLHPVADTPEALELLHREKTGALIVWSTRAAAVLAADEEQAAVLARCGEAIGLAFQITDDILDGVGDPTRMGKARGRDAREGKTTYLTLYGEEGARRLAAEQVDVAVSLVPGQQGEALRCLAQFLLERDH